MIYQLEYHPNGNCLSIHLDKQLTKEMIEAFESPDWDKERQPEFVRDIFSTVDGVVAISLHRYEISLVKGNVFEWENVIKKVLFILQMHFLKEGEEMEEKSSLRCYIDKKGFKRDIKDIH